MPLWEHVPDGEPRVFEHNGVKRVYVYGSHDIERKHYCGRDYVVWSAPVDDLTDWTYHGVVYETHYDSVLYAPDVVKKGYTYYMYAAERAGSLIVAASSKTPWGPFENPVETKLGVYEPNNGFLSYRFSDSPFGQFHDGGDISFNGGEILEDGDGCGTMTYRWGNNHGSIAQINGKWYVFYHRHTAVNEFSRQAMMEPIDVAMGKDGMRAISTEAATKHT